MLYLQWNKINSSSPNIHTKSHYKKADGFSLIELLVTIAIASIILTIAVPSLSSFTMKMRVDNEVTELQRLLLTARNAAINSGENATLCPLQADDTCKNTTVWTGRIGVVSVDGLIKEREPVQAGDILNFSLNSVTYSPSGQLDITNNNFLLFSYCPSGNADYCRGVGLSLSGRTYLSSDQNGDGRDQDRSGNNITP
jgi:type IV fimbrial biogenesis protein FimT/type IV fimbrial biogenesis protein FimU